MKSVYFWHGSRVLRYRVSDGKKGGMELSGDRCQIIRRVGKLFPQHSYRYLGVLDNEAPRAGDPGLSEKLKWCRQQMIKWARQQGLDRTGEEVAAILMAGTITQDTRLLIYSGNYERGLVRRVADRALELGIWLGCARIGSNWEPNEKDAGEVTFLCDVLAVMGLIERRATKNGVYYAAPGKMNNYPESELPDERRTVRGGSQGPEPVDRGRGPDPAALGAGPE